VSISSPTEITAETLEVYYNTSNGGSMTFPSNKLSDITDVTVNNIDAAQAVTDDQPEVGLVLKNGRYVIHFNGVSHHLISAAFSSPLAQPTTIFFYIDRDNNLNSPHVTDGIDATDRQLIYYNETKWRLYAGSSTVEVGDHDAGPNFIIVEFNGSSAKFYADGTLINTVTVSTNALGGLTMGCKYNQTSWFEGKLAQIGVFSGILSAGDRGDLDNWGRREMGLIVPLAPTNLSAVAGDEQVTLTWDETVGQTSYSLWWSLSSPVTESDTEITSVTSGHVHTGRTNGVEVFYKLQALNDSGDGPLSTEDSATPVTSAPDAPTSVSCVSGTAQNTISFTKDGAATETHLYWDTSTPVTTGSNKISDIDPDNPYVHTGRDNNVKIYYALTSENLGGESVLSSEVDGTPLAIPGSLAAVPGDASGKNSITWNTVAGAVSYKLYWKVGTVVTKSDTQIPAVTSPYVHTGLDDDVEVSYCVVAVIGSGESDLSNEDSSTPYGIPAAPTGVIATPGDGQNTLTFNPSAHATSYNFSWKLTSPVAIIDNETVGITSPHVHESLTNGVEVFYIVTALNSRGQSAMSSEVSATPTAPPPIPTGENYNIDNNLISQYLLGGNQ